MHYLLCYDLAADYLERRTEFRHEHLTLAWAAQERGELILAGACAEPSDMSLLIWKADSPDVIDQFAKADPYVIHGLVTGYRIKQWNTVVGDAALNPIRPE